VRRAQAAVIDKGINALEPVNLKVAFVTHLHSDHTVGYPDLIFTPWVMGRKAPLEVYGPKGIKAMTEHILAGLRPGHQGTNSKRPPYSAGRIQSKRTRK
jgi:ribonuclease BN (tRNA processing enzyme)